MLYTLKSFFMCRRDKKKRGFTVAETVIAMAVITLVSITAIAIVKRALVNTNKFEMCADARCTAENCLETFKYADGYPEYSSLSPKKNRKSTEILQKPGFYEITYQYGIAYTLIVKVNFNPTGRAGDYFSAICLDQGGRVVFQYDYTKG